MYRLTLFWFILLTCSALGCSLSHDEREILLFEEDDIRLYDPVSVLDVTYLEDGGSIYVRVKDARGSTLDLYVSKRMGYEEEHGDVYAHQYMGNDGSLRLRRQDEIRQVLNNAGVLLLDLPHGGYEWILIFLWVLIPVMMGVGISVKRNSNIFATLLLCGLLGWIGLGIVYFRSQPCNSIRKGRVNIS